PMSKNDPEIIEIEDWHVVSDGEVATVDEDEEPEPQYANPVWVGEMRTAGPGCCFGFSLTILVVTLIFLLGMCAACWLILRALGWIF
ncbi:MAG: hypothetical protein AB7G88_15870, partial [Thermomicrobiales bacterium]